MKLKSKILLTLIAVFVSASLWAKPLQQKTKEHKVVKGETLYSISRKYDVTVDKLKKANNGNSAVNVGQIILIPIKGNETAKPTSATKSTSHVVKAGETLYSISRDHDISVSDIKKWNNLTSNELNVGQEITLKEGAKTTESTSTHAAPTSSNAKTHAVKAGETLYSISHDLNIEISDLKKWNNLTSNELNVGQELKLTSNHTSTVTETKPKETVKPVEVKETPITTTKVVNKPTQTVFAKSSAQKKYDRIAENGKAKVASSSILDSKFSYCMHPTAPIGTVIKIMNADNGNYIYARVMGNDSQTGFLILVNKTVKERLQNSNSEFSVKISFVK